MNSGHSRYYFATNRHFKPNEWLEMYIDSWNWLTNELPGPGGKFIKMKWYVDLQKGGMPFYLLGLMLYFDNWSIGMWTYFVLHGSYGIIWVVKGMIFPDGSFEVYQSITAALSAWATVLGPYMLAGYYVASR